MRLKMKKLAVDKDDEPDGNYNIHMYNGYLSHVRK
jgi:hypothetical protein